MITRGIPLYTRSHPTTAASTRFRRRPLLRILDTRCTRRKNIAKQTLRRDWVWLGSAAHTRPGSRAWVASEREYPPAACRPTEWRTKSWRCFSSFHASTGTSTTVCARRFESRRTSRSSSIDGSVTAGVIGVSLPARSVARPSGVSRRTIGSRVSAGASFGGPDRRRPALTQKRQRTPTKGPYRSLVASRSRCRKAPSVV